MCVKVDVCSLPGCSIYARSRETRRAVVAVFGQDKVTWRAVHMVDDIDDAVALGVVVSPSVAIDGELVFATFSTVNKLTEAL